MTVIPYTLDLINENDSAVKLVRYAQIIGRAEEQFFGISRPATQADGTCDPIYTHPMRQMIARYLAEAQEEIEQVVGYPLAPRWFRNERHPYSFPIWTKWGKVIAGGFKSEVIIHAGMPLVYAADPVAFFHATTVTDTAEIKIYHPNTFIEIIPSSVVITGGNVLVEIPWARLISSAHVDNDEAGWTYTDVPPSATSPYETTVDIYRVYNDDSIQAGIVFPHLASDGTCACECQWCCGTCGDYKATGCEYVRDGEKGLVDVMPGSFGEQTLVWTASCPVCYCNDPEYVLLNYEAGLETLTPQVEDAIIRLAHSKMPSPPCGCGIANELWTRDREIPEALSPEQVNCPFGQSRGAWFAWKQALAIRLQRGMAM